MNKLILILTLCTIAFVSCNEDEAPVAPTPADTFAYDGNWLGTFSGDDQGTLDIDIDNEGVVTGSGFSQNLSQSFAITGTVSETGELKASNTSIQSTFSGTLADSTATGTWTNTPSSASGTWEVKKQ